MMSMASLYSTTPRTLIADDQPDVLEALRLLLKGEGYQTEAASSPAAVIEAVQNHDFDIVLMDLNYARDTTSGQEGLDLLTRIHDLDDTLPIVVMTAWGSVELAVEAMRRGVRDFVQKPWENSRLLTTLRAQIERGQVARKHHFFECEKKLLTKEVHGAQDLQILLNSVADHVRRSLQSRSVVILTTGNGEHSYGVSSVAANSLAQTWARNTGRLYKPDPLPNIIHADLPTSEKANLIKSSSTLCTPIYFRDELIGYIGAGPKLSSFEYDPPDQEFLAEIAEIVSVGINNARLRRQEWEFEEAREIQQGLLPKQIAQVRGYNIAAAWRPAGTISGDYFDVLKFNEDSAGLCIADVSGKGMPAALLMSNVQAMVKAFASAEIAPSKLTERINRVICNNTASGKFVTFFYCSLNTQQRRLSYTNAGHNAPILLRDNGTVVRLDADGGAVLGEFPEWSYKETEVQLRSGDTLLIFTDGITEIRNDDGIEFGEDRLIELLKDNRGATASALQQKIMAEVSEYSSGNFLDDATLIVMTVD